MTSFKDRARAKAEMDAEVEALDADSTFVNFEQADDELIGIFLKANVTGSQSKYPGVIVALIKPLEHNLEIEEGAKAVKVWCQARRLEQGFLDAMPKAGTEILIKYDGKTTGERGYHRFQVVADVEDRDLWDEISKRMVQVIESPRATKSRVRRRPDVEDVDGDLDAPF